MALSICCGEGYCHLSPSVFMGIDDSSRDVGNDDAPGQECNGSLGRSGILFLGFKASGERLLRGQEEEDRLE
jgi:hypothetical protein